MNNLLHHLPKKRNTLRRGKLLLCCFFFLFHTGTSFSQSSDLGNWWIYFGNKQFNKGFNLHHEVQYRNYNFVGDLEQLLLRTGLGYNLTEKNNNLLLGYGYIRSENYSSETEKTTVEEHRIYQQFLTKQRIGRVNIGHRYRLEERFVADQFKLRFRYFLTAKMGLNHKDLIKNTLYLSLYNEIFIGGESPLFDRNRVYAGLGYAVSPQLKFELGYMNQLFENGSRDQANVILSYNF